MRYEWDPAKARENETKHGISFAEASTVFDDPLSAIFEDPDHSRGEYRFVTIGHSTRQRLLVVTYTDRYDSIRIISSRQANPIEKRRYEEEQAKRR